MPWLSASHDQSDRKENYVCVWHVFCRHSLARHSTSLPYFPNNVSKRNILMILFCMSFCHNFTFSHSTCCCASRWHRAKAANIRKIFLFVFFSNKKRNPLRISVIIFRWFDSDAISTHSLSPFHLVLDLCVIYQCHFSSMHVNIYRVKVAHSRNLLFTIYFTNIEQRGGNLWR